MTLKHIEMGVGGGRVEGEGRLAWTAEGDSQATLRGRDVDAAATLRTLFPRTPAVARFTPGALVSGEFTGSWRGWHAATLDGTLDTTWRRRRGGLRPPERYAMAGRVRTRFAAGLWTIDLDTRVDDGVGVTGRWTMRASPADFARWPMNGSLTLDGSTPGAPRDRHESVRPRFARRPVAGVWRPRPARSRLTGALGAPEATVDVAGSLAWPDQPEIESRAQAVITTDAVRLTAFEATSGPARATSTLAIDLNSDTIDGQFEANVGVGGVVAAALRPQRAGDRHGRRHGPRLSGPLSRILIDADVTGGPVVVTGQSFDRVTGHVQYRPASRPQAPASRLAAAKARSPATSRGRARAMASTARSR